MFASQYSCSGVILVMYLSITTPFICFPHWPVSPTPREILPKPVRTCGPVWRLLVVPYPLPSWIWPVLLFGLCYDSASSASGWADGWPPGLEGSVLTAPCRKMLARAAEMLLWFTTACISYTWQVGCWGKIPFSQCNRLNVAGVAF